MNRKTLLVIVDFQRDFYHPDGALYVKGSENKIDCIKKAIRYSDDILFTLDSHPIDHCSFNTEGGPWPVHCVKNTEGCGLPLSLLSESKGKLPLFYEKGMDASVEEYGAFGESRNYFQTSSCLSLSVHNEVIVCGIAAEFCVLETSKNILNKINEYNKFHPENKSHMKIYLDGVAHFDNENKVLEDFMKDNGIEEFKI